MGAKAVGKRTHRRSSRSGSCFGAWGALVALVALSALAAATGACDVFELAGERYDMEERVLRPERPPSSLLMGDDGALYLHQMGSIPMVVANDQTAPRPLYEDKKDPKINHVSFMGNNLFLCSDEACVYWDHAAGTTHPMYSKTAWIPRVSQVSSCINHQVFFVDKVDKTVKYIFGNSFVKTLSKKINNVKIFAMDKKFNVYYLDSDDRLFRTSALNDGDVTEPIIIPKEAGRIVSLVGCGENYVFALTRDPSNVLQLHHQDALATPVPRLAGVRALAVSARGLALYNSSGLYRLRLLGRDQCVARPIAPAAPEFSFRLFKRNVAAPPVRPVRALDSFMTSKQLPILLTTVAVFVVVTCAVLRAVRDLCVEEDPCC